MKKIKFKQEKTKNGIWTDWINPVMNRYHISCCDCGLVHTMNFRAFKVLRVNKNGSQKVEILPKKIYKIDFKLFRNNKLTKQQREEKIKKDKSISKMMKKVEKLSKLL